ncbi:MAG: GNAT family N-acetyltransferase [Propionibacteriaceae bacterium]|nr:GNAT family N-acetyltransferase [Propionibacteriaceae bacterium]
MDRITSHSELLRLARGDPWIRWGLPAELVGPVWSDGTIALIQRPGVRPGFWVAPLRGPAPENGVRAALRWLAAEELMERTGGEVISVPQGCSGLAAELFDLGEGGDWEWMWTTTLPEVEPREDELVELDDLGDAAEISAFSRANNPRLWTEVGTGLVRWLGLRDAAGELVAVGGSLVEESGVDYLSGIVTARHRRGAGLASVVSGALTRRAVAADGVCTLAIFSDNDTARRVYQRLGYQTARAWSSRWLRTR